MSACSSTVRAVSRSRIPPLKTLLPFLYQTTTIQQCQSATRPIARRTITSRTCLSNGDDIPFVDENLPPPVDQGSARKTTITGTERAAFQKLYKKFNTEGRQQKEKDHVVELDQIADEYYEDDEENSKQSLDELFDKVLKGEPRLQPMRTLAQRSRMGAQLGKDAQPTKETTTGTDKARSGKKKDASFDTTQLREMRLAERERVDKLIRNAPTDRDLWQILDREVLTKVRALDLDNINNDGSKAPATEPNGSTSKKNATRPKSITKPDPPSPEQRILFQNYPHHLITAIATLRSEFPSSLLPLSILPTIKSLGRSSHALGATTTLYKHLLRTAWIQQSSFTTIDALLTEMDNNAIEFDAEILTLLDAILKENNQARSGVFGREIQIMHSMELYADGIGKISSWRKTVAERLGLKSEQIRMHDRLVRTIPQPRGPRGVVPVSGDSADSQKMERQGGDSNAVEGSSGGNGGGQEDNQLARGADPFSADVGKDGEAIPYAEGDATAETDGQENNSIAVETPNEQRLDAENSETPSEPTKIML